jgi:hypothetical protein
MSSWRVASAAAVATLACCIGVTLLLANSSWLRGHASLLVEAPVAAVAAMAEVVRRPGPPIDRESVPLARTRVPAPKDAADAAAAQATVGTPGPALSSRRCSRMEAWGDVCVYKNICMGDGHLKYFVERVQSPEMRAGTYPPGDGDGVQECAVEGSWGFLLESAGKGWKGA